MIAFAVTWFHIFEFFEQEADMLGAKNLSRSEFAETPSTFVKAYEEV